MDETIRELMASTTIPDFIYKGNNQPITTESLAYIEKLKGDDYDIVLIFETIVSRYMHCLRPFISTFEFTDDELYLYKFQPKRFCADVYQTTELWQAILHINNMISITEFKQKKIKVFTPQIIDVLEDIISLVEEDIVSNKTRVRYDD